MGRAGRLGIKAAAARLLALGRSDGLIACTDADSRSTPPGSALVSGEPGGDGLGRACSTILFAPGQGDQLLALAFVSIAVAVLLLAEAHRSTGGWLQRWPHGPRARPGVAVDRRRRGLARGARDFGRASWTPSDRCPRLSSILDSTFLTWSRRMTSSRPAAGRAACRLQHLARRAARWRPRRARRRPGEPGRDSQADRAGHLPWLAAGRDRGDRRSPPRIRRTRATRALNAIRATWRRQWSCCF